MEGRFEAQPQGPDAAADLLRDFLDAIQRVPVVGNDPNWVPLFSSQAPPPAPPSHEERAQWLNAADVEKIIGGSLSHAALSKDALQTKPATEQAGLILAQEGRWVALLRDERTFDHLIDRTRILEETTQQILSA